MLAYIVTRKHDTAPLTDGFIVRDKQYADRVHAAFHGSVLSTEEITDQETIACLTSAPYEAETEAWLGRLAASKGASK